MVSSWRVGLQCKGIAGGAAERGGHVDQLIHGLPDVLAGPAGQGDADGDRPSAIGRTHIGGVDGYAFQCGQARMPLLRQPYHLQQVGMRLLADKLRRLLAARRDGAAAVDDGHHPIGRQFPAGEQLRQFRGGQADVEEIPQRAVDQHRHANAHDACAGHRAEIEIGDLHAAAGRGPFEQRRIAVPGQRRAVGPERVDQLLSMQIRQDEIGGAAVACGGACLPMEGGQVGVAQGQRARQRARHGAEGLEFAIDVEQQIVGGLQGLHIAARAAGVEFVE